MSKLLIVLAKPYMGVFITPLREEKETRRFRSILRTTQIVIILLQSC